MSNFVGWKNRLYFLWYSSCNNILYYTVLNYLYSGPTKAESPPNEQLKLDKRESFGNSTNNTDGGLAISQITEQQSDTGKFNK